jgi:hypothetical protein
VVLVGVELRLEQQLLELVLGQGQRVGQLELRLEQRQQQQQERQSLHRNHGQQLQASKRHHASTGCRRRFSTADCRGQSASYQKRHWSQRPLQSQ